MAAERARTEAEERRKRDEEAARLAKAEADRVRELQVRWQCSGSSATCSSIVFAQFAAKSGSSGSSCKPVPVSFPPQRGLHHASSGRGVLHMFKAVENIESHAACGVTSNAAPMRR